MAKTAKKGKGKVRSAVKREKHTQPLKANGEAPDMAQLRKPVLAARAKLGVAEAEAKQLAEKARMTVAQGRSAYREALASCRQACNKAGVACEFEGGRSANVSPKASFVVEKTDQAIRVAVEGKPASEELIPLAALKASVGKAAIASVDKHLGPREHVGNKAGSLANRLRAVMVGKR